MLKCGKVDKPLFEWYLCELLCHFACIFSALDHDCGILTTNAVY